MAFDWNNFDLHTPELYASRGYPWEAWHVLRAEAPVYWYEREDIDPFWAVTRHADVVTVSGHPDVFINGGPRLRLARRGEAELLRGGLDEFGTSRGWDPDEPPDMTFMDDPRHRQVRKASSWAFIQGCMRGMATHFETLAEQFTDEFRAALSATGTVDLVRELACKLPLAATGARSSYGRVPSWARSKHSTYGLAKRWRRRPSAT